MFYDVGMFGSHGAVLMLNPIAPILEALNAVVVLHTAPDLFWLSYSAIVTALSLAAAWMIFAVAERKFAEVV